MTGSSVLRIGIVGCGRAAQNPPGSAARSRPRSPSSAAPIPIAHSAESLGCAGGPGQGAEPRSPVSTITGSSSSSRRSTPCASSLLTSGTTAWRWTPFRRGATSSSRSRCRRTCRRPSISWGWHGDVAPEGRRGAPVPALSEPGRKLADCCEQGAIGRLRLVTATLAQPWLAAQEGSGE